MKPLPKLEPNRKRAYLRCNECKAVYWYDYRPFGLSCPVTTKPCGHGVTQPLYSTSTSITKRQFMAAAVKTALGTPGVAETDK